MGENGADVYLLPLKFDANDQPVVVSTDIKHREPLDLVGGRKVPPNIGKVSPLRTGNLCIPSPKGPFCVGKKRV